MEHNTTACLLSAIAPPAENAGILDAAQPLARYRNAPPLLAQYGLPPSLEVVRSSWGLSRALKWSRSANPRHVCKGRCEGGRHTGSGIRRRASHEYELDRLLAILKATQTPGAAARLPGRQTVHAWELLYAHVGHAPAIAAYRAKIETLLTWCRDNHPREGWARKQSSQRARRLNPGGGARAYATEWNLPARSRAAFYAYRRAVRAIARLLRVLHIWFETLCPAPRSPSSRYETTGSDHEAREGEVGTRYRSQRPVSMGALLGEAMPPRAM